jgi:hypothetical protein
MAVLQNFVGGTLLGDLIVRPNFGAWTSERIYELSRFVQSGLIERNQFLAASAGGTRTQLPMLTPIDPTSERIDSSEVWGTSGAGYLSIQKVGSQDHVVSIYRRGFAYGTDDISKMGSGLADPLGHVRDQLAAAVNKLNTTSARSVMEGAFGPIVADGVLQNFAIDKTGGAAPTAANYLAAGSVIEAKQLLGERGTDLTGMVMHSAVASYLEEQGYMQALVDGSTVFAGQGIGVGSGSGFAGRAFGMNVIIDDQFGPLAGGLSGDVKKYPVYLAKGGVMQTASQSDLRINYDRNILSFQDQLAVDFHQCHTIPGVSWTSATDNPTDAALATSTNYGASYTDLRNVGLVRLLVNTPYDPTTYA